MVRLVSLKTIHSFLACTFWIRLFFELMEGKNRNFVEEAALLLADMILKAVVLHF